MDKSSQIFKLIPFLSQSSHQTRVQPDQLLLTTFFVADPLHITYFQWKWSLNWTELWITSVLKNALKRRRKRNILSLYIKVCFFTIFCSVWENLCLVKLKMLLEFHTHPYIYLWAHVTCVWEVYKVHWKKDCISHKISFRTVTVSFLDLGRKVKVTWLQLGLNRWFTSLFADPPDS